jgi:hypothetical protein
MATFVSWFGGRRLKIVFNGTDEVLVSALNNPITLRGREYKWSKKVTLYYHGYNGWLILYEGFLEPYGKTYRVSTIKRDESTVTDWLIRSAESGELFQNFDGSVDEYSTDLFRLHLNLSKKVSDLSERLDDLITQLENWNIHA